MKSFIGTLAIPSVRQMSSQFRLNDHPNSDKWNDYILNGERMQSLLVS